MMNASAENFVLIAKRLQIEELRNLAGSARLVDQTGKLIHALQAERGASSLYLASSGSRFRSTRQELVRVSESIEGEFRNDLNKQLKGSTFGNARLLHLMAWILIGLDDLPALRQRISVQNLPADEAIAAFSRLIAGMTSLIFEVADAAIDARISGLLVALFNLVQGKELAGQERALGALAIASGHCPEAHQTRILHLIDAQERHLNVYAEFMSPPLRADWQLAQQTPFVAALERMRRMLCSRRPGSSIDANLSDPWFEACSLRLDALWVQERGLVDLLKQRCAELILEAEADLRDSEGLLKALREHPPARAGQSDRFFDLSRPIEAALSFAPPGDSGLEHGKSIIDLLQAQSEKLANMENELGSARRALEERKSIERAKGVLMARFRLSEDEAYKHLRSAAMDQNRRMADVADGILASART